MQSKEVQIMVTNPHNLHFFDNPLLKEKYYLNKS